MSKGLFKKPSSNKKAKIRQLRDLIKDNLNTKEY